MMAAVPNVQRRRLWLFRLIAIGCGLLPFVLLEAGLRWAGFGHDLQLVIPIHDAPGWWQLNSNFDEPYFGRANLSGPQPRPFRLPKPAGTLRILVVGGSTVVGFPFDSDLAFPRMLEVLLQEQVGPDATVEVLNAGITAISSSTEAAVVIEGITCDLDLIVVYSGHNEFYGPGGVASGVVQLHPAWFRALARLSRLRMVQAARRLIAAWQRPPGDLISSFSENVHIALNGPIYERAMTRFEQNLETMVEAAAAKQIPVLLAGPVANERHQPPIEPAIPPPAEQEPPWYAVVRTAERHLQYEAPEKALAALAMLPDAEQQHAIVQFRMAQAHDKLAAYDVATVHYQRALELDGGRFRAPPQFRKVMERVAARHAGHTRYVDLHAALCHDDPDGIPGGRHFLEHVHFTRAGNAAVARALGRFIQQEVWSRSWSEERLLSDEALCERLPILPEEEVAAILLSILIYEKPPFRDASDAPLLAKELAWQSVAAVRALPAGRSALFEQVPTSAMTGDLLATTLAACRSAGLDDDVGSLLGSAVRRRPWRCDHRREWVEWLTQHGRNATAQSVRAEAAHWPCVR